MAAVVTCFGFNLSDSGSCLACVLSWQAVHRPVEAPATKNAVPQGKVIMHLKMRRVQTDQSILRSEICTAVSNSAAAAMATSLWKRPFDLLQVGQQTIITGHSARASLQQPD
jgi:hypothetical protein